MHHIDTEGPEPVCCVMLVEDWHHGRAHFHFESALCYPKVRQILKSESNMNITLPTLLLRAHTASFKLVLFFVLH